jgi:hypothetical protein
MSTLTTFYKKTSEKLDLPFLLFLLAISPNKIYLKLLALLLIFAMRPRFDFLFSRKLPLFYPLIILLATLQFLVFGHDFSTEHMLVFFTGILYWTLCYGYLYQASLFAGSNSNAKINGTLAAFVVLNFLFCVFNYFSVCVKAHTLLPFLESEGGDYGPSTGDYIYGLFGQPSYINSIVCFLLALYFIHKNKPGMFFLATFSALLSFSNIINIIFVVALVTYAAFSASRRKYMLALANIVLCIVTYMVLNPNNFNYVRKTIGLSVNNEKEIMPEVVTAKKSKGESKQARLKYVNDSSAASQKIVLSDRDELFNRNYDRYVTYRDADIKTAPGKKIALLQTLTFMKKNPIEAVFGAGIGNFSSRLAFQFSGRDSSRLFMKLPKYAHGYYFMNHLLIYDYMRQLPNEYHSIKHFPNNFLSQLLGEYGLIGLGLFLVFYLWYFYKRIRNKLYFLIIWLCAAGFLMLDYMYEFFNVMLIVELLMFIEIKQQQEPEATKE